jgi:Protein of unknown function (DUF3105)
VTRIVVAAAAVVAVFAMMMVGGCSGDDSTGNAARATVGGDSGCDPVERLVEPNQGHVLPGVEVTYVHRPPSSGRHVPELPELGVHDAPIEEARQVFALENGYVLLQYGPQLSDDDRRALERIAVETEQADLVIVAPAVSIDGDRPVALTAWQTRQLCDGVAPDTAASFIESFAGQGPEGA